MQEVVLKEEIKALLKGRYIIYRGDGLVRLGEAVELAKENFKVYFVDSENVWQELTVDDFTWYEPENGDYDYEYPFEDEYRYIYRYGVPDEVREFLDKSIKKRMENNPKEGVI